MKCKLLKKLRKQFKIIYYPNTKQYVLYDGNTPKYYRNNLRNIKREQYCLIINEARENYRKYSKQILIKP